MNATLSVSEIDPMPAADGQPQPEALPRSTNCETYVVALPPTFRLVRERDRDLYVVRDVDTGIFGTGTGVSEALGDFFQAAREHLDVLERQDDLSEELTWQLSYLRDRIGREA